MKTELMMSFGRLSISAVLPAAALACCMVTPEIVRAQETQTQPEVGRAAPGGDPSAAGGDGGGDPGGDPSVYINAPVSVPPEHFALSPGGVDMRTGQYRYEHNDLSIGGDKALSLTRTSTDSAYPFGRNDRFGTLTHNWELRLEERRVEVTTANYPYMFDYLVIVSGRRSATFRSPWSPLPGHSFKELSLAGNNKIDFTYMNSSRGRIPTQYTFTSEDGSAIVFRPMDQPGCGAGSPCPYAASVQETDGSRYDLSYDTSNGQSLLKSVTSNRGYALVFEYDGIGLITKACAVNLTLTTLPASCPAGVPTSTYVYATGTFGQKSLSMTSFIDQSGQSSLVGPFGSIVYDPGSSSPKIISNLVNYNSLTVASQSFADGQTLNYTWNHVQPYAQSADTPEGGRFVDKAGRIGAVTYGGYPIPNSSNPTYIVTPGPESITDQLGRVWRYDYCTPNPVAAGCVVSLLQKRTDPEGSFTTFSYDGYRNVVETVSHPKPGSPLADIVTSATYTCAPANVCDKRATVTNGRGDTTSYTYDPAHGGILTESAPPDASGIRPVKRHGYTQRHARISDGAGGYMAMSPAIWLPATDKTCRTTATVGDGCAGGAADEVVTAYDYGPDTGPNNLLLRGVTVTADGQTRRTCYGYDYVGNRISETTPRAALGSCS